MTIVFKEQGNIGNTFGKKWSKTNLEEHVALLLGNKRSWPIILGNKETWYPDWRVGGAKKHARLFSGNKETCQIL